jgi:hypothetical protein
MGTVSSRRNHMFAKHERGLPIDSEKETKIERGGGRLRCGKPDPVPEHAFTKLADVGPKVSVGEEDSEQQACALFQESSDDEDEPEFRPPGSGKRLKADDVLSIPPIATSGLIKSPYGGPFVIADATTSSLFQSDVSASATTSATLPPPSPSALAASAVASAVASATPSPAPSSDFSAACDIDDDILDHPGFECLDSVRNGKNKNGVATDRSGKRAREATGEESVLPVIGLNKFRKLLESDGVPFQSVASASHSDTSPATDHQQTETLRAKPPAKPPAKQPAKGERGRGGRQGQGARGGRGGCGKGGNGGKGGRTVNDQNSTANGMLTSCYALCQLGQLLWQK